jgi:hypothetical protein
MNRPTPTTADDDEVEVCTVAQCDSWWLNVNSAEGRVFLCQECCGERAVVSLTLVQLPEVVRALRRCVGVRRVSAERAPLASLEGTP